MRYTVLTSRTFHNRITKNIGVLVGAALVATLGLPSAVQAQTPSPPMPVYVPGSDTFTLTPAGNAYSGFTPEHTHWVYEYITPGNPPAWRAVEGTGTGPTNTFSVGVRGAEGTWQFQLKSIAAGAATEATIPPTPGAIQVYIATASATDPPMYVVPVAKATGTTPQSPWSGLVDYTHGTPPEPQDFAYISRPGSPLHVFAWADAYKSDKGIAGYKMRWSTGDPLLAATEWIDGNSGKVFTGSSRTLTSTEVKTLKDGELYTFELTTVGVSSSVFTKQAQSSDPASVMVPIGMVPTPTLPELAALFLALLLLASGAYLLRGRQVGGLTRT